MVFNFMSTLTAVRWYENKMTKIQFASEDMIINTIPEYQYDFEIVIIFISI